MMPETLKFMCHRDSERLPVVVADTTTQHRQVQCGNVPSGGSYVIEQQKAEECKGKSELRPQPSFLASAMSPKTPKLRSVALLAF